ncbi:MAG: hypothetical protein Q4B26_12360 [Eubacteriales bacterium]|nr:hypothetical protein [Eubacteriales bacterium]
MDKTKANLEQIQKELKPFLRKAFLQKSYVDSNDVTPICCSIRRKYSNVDIAPKPGADGKPYLMIRVHRFLVGGELSYEIKVKGKSIRTHKLKDPLEWIDRIEDWHAMIDD